MKIVQRTLDFFFDGNVFIALCALMQVQLSFQLLGLRNAHNPLPIFVFCATFWAYNLHKIITLIHKPALLEPHHKAFLQSNRIPLSIALVLSFLFGTESAFACIHQAAVTESAFWSHVAALSLLTLIPVLPLPNGKRLRELPFVKIGVTASVWGYALTILPHLCVGTQDFPFIVSHFLEKTVFIFTLCLYFDVRDMAWDARLGVKTIPLSIGVRKTLLLGFVALSLGSCVHVYWLLTLKIDFPTFTARVVSQLVAILIGLLTPKFLASKRFFNAVDAVILLQAMLVLPLNNS